MRKEGSVTAGTDHRSRSGTRRHRRQRICHQPDESLAVITLQCRNYINGAGKLLGDIQPGATVTVTDRKSTAPIY